jgi:hypothetical protein
VLEKAMRGNCDKGFLRTSDGANKTDVSLTYYAPNSKWDIALYGNNLENVATIASVGETGRPYPFAGVAYVERPRLYGVRFHFKVGSSE